MSDYVAPGLDKPTIYGDVGRCGVTARPGEAQRSLRLGRGSASQPPRVRTRELDKSLGGCTHFCFGPTVYPTKFLLPSSTLGYPHTGYSGAPCYVLASEETGCGGRVGSQISKIPNQAPPIRARVLTMSPSSACWYQSVAAARQTVTTNGSRRALRSLGVGARGNAFHVSPTAT